MPAVPCGPLLLLLFLLLPLLLLITTTTTTITTTTSYHHIPRIAFHKSVQNLLYPAFEVQSVLRQHTKIDWEKLSKKVEAATTQVKETTIYESLDKMKTRSAIVV